MVTLEPSNPPTFQPSNPSPLRAWSNYPADYRAKELRLLADWISTGESGAVVGLSGAGRANLLGFLCHRPEVVAGYLRPGAGPIALIPLDLNNLPATDLSTLYRVLIRAFYRVRAGFEPGLAEEIAALYRHSQAETDPFLTQSTLQELLLLFQARQTRVVLVLNRFDDFCQAATPAMVNTLRGLRDDFKDTLCYLAGMTREAVYLPEPERLGDMYELLDHHVCWVGALQPQDARYLVRTVVHAAPTPPEEEDVAALLALSGNYPTLLRAACHWWLAAEKPPRSEWVSTLLGERQVQHRLERLWQGLTQEEQFVLSELQKLETARLSGGDKKWPEFVEAYQPILRQLAGKGVCQYADKGWRLAGALLSAFVARVEGRGRGRIWQDERTGELYQGQTLLADLTGLERAVLTFLLKQPRFSHTKTDLIFNAWPDELRQQGVSDNSLYQLISSLRRQIEPNPSRPAYLVTWRGKPEGGYQFFPEGRPR
ncbi:MAG: hypothetical protein DPW09_13340 [Anaerolineae bacterium]|nr:winged helix-turn-helix domain-containing protein [Anaerolineales bacterium]MCQ3974423.1 hypothetical protein [Anaerolineae bacterium]